jgi:hypothetical protein
MRAKKGIRDQAQEALLNSPSAYFSDAMPDDQVEGTMISPDMTQFPDGSVAIDQYPVHHLPKMNTNNHDENLAMLLPEHVLQEIGNHLKTCVEDDQRSQELKIQVVADSIELLGINASENSNGKSTSYEGASNVYSSALFETTLDYVATIVSSTFPSTGPADSVIYGEASPELEDIAYRKKLFTNNFLTRVDKGFYKEYCRAVFWSVLTPIYVKVFIDNILGRPTIRMIKLEDLIINRELSSHLAATRVTQIHRIDSREFLLRKLIGEYREIDLMPMPIQASGENLIQDTLDEVAAREMSINQGQDYDTQYEVWECHVDYQIKEDPEAQDIEIPLPYIISLDANSGRVLRIQRNWKEDDYLKKSREFFVNFSLFPSLDGEGYGLIQHGAGLARAATELTRQTLTSAMYSNFPGGVYQAGLRLENNSLRPLPGEFLPLQTGGIPISQAIQPLPYKEPSQALMELKQQLEDSIKRPSSIVNHELTELAMRAPMGSTLSMLETMQKVPNFGLEGYHKSFDHLLELLNERFAEWLPEGQSYPFSVPGGNHVIMKSDFQNNIQVVTANDPSLQNAMYRFMRAEIILNNARQAPDIHDMRFANEMFYKNLNLSQDEIKKLLPEPKQENGPIPLDPITENQNLLNGKPVTAGIMQDHDAHIQVHNLLLDDQTAGPAAHAHIKEHEALKFLVHMQQQIGFEMPQDPTQIAPEMQNQIAVAAAQVAEQMKQQQQAEQGPPQPTPEQISADAMVQDVQMRKEQNELKARYDQEKLELDRYKTEGDFELRKTELEQKYQLELMKLQASANKDQQAHIMNQEAVLQQQALPEESISTE